MAGKGDKPRPVNKVLFDKNFDRIFKIKILDDEQESNTSNKKPFQTQKTNKKSVSK